MVRQSFPIIGNKIGNKDFANWTGDIQKCDIWHEYSKYCGINVLCCMLYCKSLLDSIQESNEYTLINLTKSTGKGKQIKKENDTSELSWLRNWESHTLQANDVAAKLQKEKRKEKIAKGTTDPEVNCFDQ